MQPKLECQRQYYELILQLIENNEQYRSIMNNPDYYRLITRKDFLMSRPRDTNFLNVQDSNYQYAPSNRQAPSPEPTKLINRQEVKPGHETNPRQLTVEVNHRSLSDDIVNGYPTNYNDFT